MKAYYFRFLNEDNTPTGHMGMAVAETMADLFLTIDQFGDPYSTEIRVAKEGAMCVRITDNEDEDEGPEVGELELSDEFYEAVEGKWKAPVWPPYEEIYSLEEVS